MATLELFDLDHLIHELHLACMDHEEAIFKVRYREFPIRQGILHQFRYTLDRKTPELFGKYDIKQVPVCKFPQKLAKIGLIRTEKGVKRQIGLYERVEFHLDRRLKRNDGVPIPPCIVLFERDKFDGKTNDYRTDYRKVFGLPYYHDLKKELPSEWFVGNG